MDRESIEISLTEFINEVLKFYDPKSIYLFGSYANGTANENSDIDIALVYDNYESEAYLDDLAYLWKIAGDIDYRIEPVIVDKKDEKTGFLTKIKNTGILIK